MSPLAGYHLLPLKQGNLQGSWDQCFLDFFPICYDWRAERLPAKASHREVWVQDALSMTADELEDAETNEDFIKFVQGGESTSWGGDVRSGAGAIGIKLQSGIWRLVNRLSRKIFGISLRRGFPPCFVTDLERAARD